LSIWRTDKISKDNVEKAAKKAEKERIAEEKKKV
jgi:hypothetical protein